MTIKETSPYDNYLDFDKRKDDKYSKSIERLLGKPIKAVDPDKKKIEDDRTIVSKGYKSIYIHFANLDDYFSFCQLMNRTIDYNTKEICYPMEETKSKTFTFFKDEKRVVDRELLRRKKEPKIKINPDDKFWKKHWKGMPEFIQNKNHPYKSLTIHFRREQDYHEFGKLIGQELTDKTKSIWHPEPNRTPNFVYRWMQEEGYPSDPRHPVYIVSKGRYDYMHTSRSLSRMKVKHFIVVEPQEFTLYDKALDNFNIRPYVTLLEAPFSNHGDGPGRARNWAWDHAISIGSEAHWVLDDNIQDFYRLHQNKRIRVESGVFFRVMEDFVDRYDNVYIAGPQYRFFIAPDSAYPAFSINTRIYSCLLIRNDCKHRWRGRYNEDTDICLRVLKDGDCTIQFNAFLQGKMATQTVKGGNTDEFYHKEFADQEDSGYNPKGTINKSQMLVDMHPDVATLVWKYGRWHHHVDYTIFKSNYPKLKDHIKLSRMNSINDYGMYLVDNYGK